MMDTAIATVDKPAKDGGQTVGNTTDPSTVAEEAEDGVKIYYIDPVEIRRKPVFSAVKRAFDIVMSLLGIIICALPILIVAVIIRIDSKGPAIYKQERLGLHGRPFMMYKFRSMFQDAEKDGAQWAEYNDSRCTRVGAVIRRFRIDELPQLLNILTGRMSFVGPRPERAVFYDRFEKYIHGFRYRLLVKPGLTGHAQINGGYDLLPEEKIIYDMEYIKKRSLWMDFKCIVKTVGTVFRHKGAR